MSRGPSITIYQEVEVDVYLTEFSTEELLQELRRREHPEPIVLRSKLEEMKAEIAMERLSEKTLDEIENFFIHNK